MSDEHTQTVLKLGKFNNILQRQQCLTYECVSRKFHRCIHGGARGVNTSTPVRISLPCCWPNPVLTTQIKIPQAESIYGGESGSANTIQTCRSNFPRFRISGFPVSTPPVDGTDRSWRGDRHREGHFRSGHCRGKNCAHERRDQRERHCEFHGNRQLRV